ncbi:MAG: dihydrolipoamide acetyltransferase family protein [Bacteroidota bacterium]
MPQVELVMPKMGESIMEATILKWVKQVGDEIDVDDTVLEIATDKVDSEVPSPVAGKLAEIKFQEDEVVPIGTVIALIETEAGAEVAASPSVSEEKSPSSSRDGGERATPEREQVEVAKPAESAPAQQPAAPQPVAAVVQQAEVSHAGSIPEDNRFYSPLVRNMAKEEGVTAAELATIDGSGKNGRVTKKDMLNYLRTRAALALKGHPAPVAAATNGTAKAPATTPVTPTPVASNGTTSAPRPQLVSGATEIIEMDRMRKLIADHMVMSKHTSPHVTSFIEVDVTELFNWRSRVKNEFQAKYGEKITFTPIFMEAVARALTDFPMVNVSVEGSNIIRKLDINIGMATALPSGNLIVPVIKNADQLNLVGLTKSVNDLASRARANKLKPEEIQGGTFTLTNVGTFGNLMGTPIINQPQVAILAVGAIRKKPAVVETQYGDLIAVRQMMFMSLSYDHRVVDGALGGTFLRRIGDYLEAFDGERGV